MGGSEIISIKMGYNKWTNLEMDIVPAMLVRKRNYNNILTDKK